MSQAIIRSLRLWLALAASYLCLIARWGYEYGRNDEMQTQAYAKMLNNPVLYPVDNYLQNLHAKIPNERFVFSWLLSLTGDYQEIACVLLHITTSLLQFFLWYKIARLFIKTDYLIWLGLLTLFVPLFGINLGGNELYYNSFFVSNLVQLIALFGIYLFLKKNYIIALSIIALVTLLQPVIGIQLFITCSGILLIGKLLNLVDIEWITLFKTVGIWILTGGLWVIFLKIFFEEQGISNAAFFVILFEFRAPHHYLPLEFPLKDYLLMIPLLLFGTIFYLRKEIRIGLFFLISWVGMLTHLILVEGFSEVNAASLQWFKITIWLKAFSVFALFAFIEKSFPFIQNKTLKQLAFPVLISVGTAILIILIFARSLFFWNVPFDYGSHYKNDAAVEISLLAKRLSPEDALFLHPINFTTLKVYGERSSMVDYKVLVHRKKAMIDWYARIGEVYGVNVDSRKVGLQLFDLADKYFRNMDEATIKELQKKYAITHLITFKDHYLDFQKIASNDKYQIYLID